MKNKVLKVSIFAIFFIGMIIACQKEIVDKPDDGAADIIQARIWYENLYSPELVLKSTDLTKGKTQAKPDWSLAIRSKHKDSKTVETPLIVQGEFGFASKESYQAFKETGDKKFILSRTTMVIEKKGDKTIGFLMTIVPDKEYQEANDFNALSSTYRKWQKAFSGIVLYHNLDGSFSNGWRLSEGKVVTTIKHKGEDGHQIQLSSKGCLDWYYVQCEYTFYLDFKGTNGWTYNEQWTYLYTTCDGGDYGGGIGGGGGGGESEAIYNPIETPCQGDPINNLSIASPGNSGIMGGMFGCVRIGSDSRCDDKDYHGGIDIACDPSTDVYAMRGGVVYDFVSSYPPGTEGDGTSKGDLGNYVTVRYTNVDGSTTDITYAHLDYVNSTLSYNSPIDIGQPIGLSGTTGNAVNVPNPHVHIQIFQDNIRVDPAGYFASYISPDGTVSDPCGSY